MPEPDWTPTTADVAAEIPARVKDRAGNPLEDFDDCPRPTKPQVERAIAQSVDDVVAKIGTLATCTASNIAELRESAKSLAVLRTAMRIERQYFPDQVTNDRSPYNALRDEYAEAAKVLIEAVADSCGGGGGESVGGGSGPLPAYSFDDYTLIGRDTNFG